MERLSKTYLVAQGMIDELTNEDINFIDSVGYNMLYYAKDIDTFNFLVSKGVDVNRLNMYNQNMLPPYNSSRDYLLHALDVMVLGKVSTQQFCAHAIANDELRLFDAVFNPKILDEIIIKSFYQSVARGGKVNILEIMLRKDPGVIKNVNHKKFMENIIKKGRVESLRMVIELEVYKHEHDLIEMSLKYRSTNILHFLLYNNYKSKYTDEGLLYLQNWNEEAYQQVLKHLLDVK